MGTGPEYDYASEPEVMARYEALRAQALEASGGPGRAWGWALFVQKGMAAWLEAWGEPLLPDAPECAVSYGSVPAASPEQHREIVMVWTGMIMGQLARSIVCTP